MGETAAQLEHRRALAVKVALEGESLAVIRERTGMTYDAIRAACKAAGVQVVGRERILDLSNNRNRKSRAGGVR